MPKLIDLTGKRFGRLVVQKRSSNSKGGKPMWVCHCDCGNFVIVLGNDLNRGHTKSCGCFRKDSARDKNIKHGYRYTRIYKSWLNMKTRCYNIHSKDFKNYGSRGIKVCDEWLNDFQSFYDWALANGYKDDLSIDRIDANGNYEPSNCRWANAKKQANNKTKNHYVVCNGEKHTISEWAEITGIKAGTLWYRITHGWSPEKALEVQK